MLIFSKNWVILMSKLDNLNYIIVDTKGGILCIIMEITVTMVDMVLVMLALQHMLDTLVDMV